MNIYELRFLGDEPFEEAILTSSLPKVLVVAGDRNEAIIAASAALGLGDAPLGLFPDCTLCCEDLGEHVGPEPPGAVFVNGFRIASTEDAADRLLAF